MIDPSLCSDTSVTDYWASTSGRVFRWLCTPSQVIPVLLVPIALPWLIRPLRRKRLWSGLGMLVMVGYLMVASPGAIAAGNQLLIKALPSDSGAAADAIVVLGRGAELRPQRVQEAEKLWKAQRAPLIFVSGINDAPSILEKLKRRDIPQSALDGEPCSRTTEENALFTTLLLKPRSVHRILLVTDPPHMLRSMLTFRSLGFEVVPHLSPLPGNLGERRHAVYVFREYIGLVGYGVMGRFWPRQVPANTAIAQNQSQNEQFSEIAPFKS